jgi:hypothetical protein
VDAVERSPSSRETASSSMRRRTDQRLQRMTSRGTRSQLRSQRGQ